MRRARHYLQWLARAGYAARGAVFVMLAYFTAVAALDAYTEPVDGKDALRALLFAPLGGVLLFAIGVGLACFALWREAQLLLDPDGCGSDPKGLARRIVYGAAGLFYLAFASVALSMLVGIHTTGTERAVHDWTALLLAQPFGRVALGAIGGVIIISGLCIGVAGIRAEFRNRIALAGKPHRVVTILGRVGYLTRAVVVALIGLFLVFAALDANAYEATGLAGALAVIRRQPYGSALLAVTALGLLAFGIYGLAEAAFRRIDGKSVAAGTPSWLRA